MQVKLGERICLDAAAVAAATEDLLFHDYYTRTPCLSLSGQDADGPATAVSVTLDANDVARILECAVRHPNLNMRQAVVAALWNHPETFRRLFRFGLEAPPEFAEIRRVVAEELAKRPAAQEAAAAKPSPEALLPAMPLPPHLRRAKGRK
jgi:hypothetical protein